MKDAALSERASVAVQDGLFPWTPTSRKGTIPPSTLSLGRVRGIQDQRGLGIIETQTPLQEPFLDPGNLPFRAPMNLANSPILGIETGELPIQNGHYLESLDKDVPDRKVTMCHDDFMPHDIEQDLDQQARVRVVPVLVDAIHFRDWHRTGTVLCSRTNLIVSDSVARMVLPVLMIVFLSGNRYTGQKGPNRVGCASSSFVMRRLMAVGVVVEF